MQLPSVAIVTPSFNQAEFIERTLRSVVEQGYPELDYHVMDGGSTDGTVALLGRQGAGVRWVSQKDGGQSAALISGFARTRGDVLGWVNSDDEYAPGALRAVGEFFATHPEVQWLHGRCPIIDRAGRVQRRWVSRYKEFFCRRYRYEWLLVENFISQPATFFRRSFYERVGGLDARYHCAMDYDLWLRMGKVAPPAFLDRELARFRMWGENKMSVAYEKSFAEEIDAVRAVTAGERPWLMALHHANRLKLLVAYKVLAAR